MVKKSKEIDIQQKISSLNEKIDLLDKKFYFYFTARDKIPPLTDFIKIRQEVELLRAEKDKIILERKKFVIRSFLQRFAAYRSKWEKALKEIEDARAKPNPLFFSRKNNEKKADAA